MWNRLRTARGGQYHVRVLGRGGDGGNPSLMTSERAEETETFGHSECVVVVVGLDGERGMILAQLKAWESNYNSCTIM
jgi:hypothetical protein